MRRKNDPRPWLMPKKLKAKWLRALRSGKYSQGDSYLKYIDDGSCFFCCLGVYHDITGGEWDIRDGDEAFRAMFLDNYYDVDDNMQLLPNNVLPQDIQSLLAHMNDGVILKYKKGHHTNLLRAQWPAQNKRSVLAMKFTFEEIADWIEKNL